jgi:hypothetical protein
MLKFYESCSNNTNSHLKPGFEFKGESRVNLFRHTCAKDKSFLKIQLHYLRWELVLF